MEELPVGLKQLISFSKGEVKRLRQDYHIFLGMTVLTAASATLSLLVGIFLGLQDNDLALRMLLVLSSGMNFAVAIFLYNETMKRRRYLVQIEQMIKKGATFLESIKSLFRN